VLSFIWVGTLLDLGSRTSPTSDMRTARRPAREIAYVRPRKAICPPRHHAHYTRMTEYATQVPTEHKFDPYVENGGSILGTRS